MFQGDVLTMVLQSFTARNWPIFALLLSLSLWLGALAFEHIGGLAPCQMCYWQRHAHKAVIVIAVIALIVRQFTMDRRWESRFLALIGLAFLLSFGLAFWHVGVEFKWWEGPKTCMVGAGASDFNTESLLNALENPVEMPACSEAPWHLLNISMAGYNAVFSGLAALISFVFVVKARA